MNPLRLQQRSKLQSGSRGPQTRPRDGLARPRGVASYSPPRAGLRCARAALSRRGAMASTTSPSTRSRRCRRRRPPRSSRSCGTRAATCATRRRMRSIENAHCHGGGGWVSPAAAGSCLLRAVLQPGPPPPPDRARRASPRRPPPRPSCPRRPTRGAPAPGRRGRVRRHGRRRAEGPLRRARPQGVRGTSQPP